MACYTYINNSPEPVFMSGTTCYQGLSGFTLPVGQAICMNVDQPIYICGDLTIGAGCLPVTPTPTQTKTPTQTATQTPTKTSTQTPTQTLTQTSTPTQTATQTSTPTNTLTPTNTITSTQTPTKTATQTPTVTKTPTQTSNPACGVAFNLEINPAPQTVPNGFYGRVTLSATTATTTTFDYGYLSYFDAFTGTVIIGTAPDGNSYPIYQQDLGIAGYATFFRVFSGSTDFGWGVKERINNIFTGTSNLTSGSTVYGEYDYIDIGGVRYPPNGTIVFSGGFEGGTSYLFYPTVCFTPTPTLSQTKTPTQTPTNTLTPSPTRSPNATPEPTPTQTPTNSPTPSITASPTITPSVTPTNSATPTITQTPTNTITKTPTTTTTLTSTPTQTPTITASVTPTPTITASVTPTFTQTPTKTPTTTPTVTQVWYYYTVYGFDCRFPNPCIQSLNPDYVKSKIPLQTGYYCDAISGSCGGLRITGSATPNQAYGEWEYNRYPTRTSGACSQNMCP